MFSVTSLQHNVAQLLSLCVLACFSLFFSEDVVLFMLTLCVCQHDDDPMAGTE